MARNVFETLTVLVVDDSSHMRYLLLGLLRALGVGEIIMAKDGDEAWSHYVKHKPDLVITDAAMAPTDGFALAKRLRDDDIATSRHIPRCRHHRICSQTDCAPCALRTPDRGR